MPGEEATVTGVVQDRRVIRPRSGSEPFVKATLVTDDGDEVTVVWWDAGRAPVEGARVTVRGRVSEYGGRLELHADVTDSERHGPPDDPVAQVIGFYIGCVEAEAAGEVRVRPGGRGHVELGAGASPLIGDRRLPGDDSVEQWCRQRELALGESIVAGWPLVVGAERANRASGLVAAPLLMCDVRLVRNAGAWGIEPDAGGVDLNPFALDLLGIHRDERDAMARLVEQSSAVEEARSGEERATAILGVLEDGGVDGLDRLDPHRLVPLDGSAGVHNTGLVVVANRSTQITRMLLEDLQEMRSKPGLAAGTPAAVMLGQDPAPVASLPMPHPTVVPSTLAQDQAVASAMENVLTVVTGPPGTGKSQVLVNVVAAAVAREETVLFASKNNKAVDVVFERLASASTDPCIVRAGAASRRSEVAQSITGILAAPRRAVSPAEARRRWAEVERRVGAIHEVQHRRARLEGELGQAKADLRDRTHSLEERVRAHSDAVNDLALLDADADSLDADPDRLEEAVARARVALDAFADGLGWFRRWRKHRQRLDQAREELAALKELAGLGQDEIDAPLRSVPVRPRRSLAPRRDLGPVEKAVAEIVDTIRWVQATRAEIARRQEEIDRQRAEIARQQEEIDRQRAEIDSLPSKQELDDQIHAIAAERNAAGRALIDARWEQVRRDDPAARTAAGQLAELLSPARSQARRARGLIESALPAIPVWGVTNLSARTNLPLISGMFDLVVIDEASQCDVASALPLLARARRALIIGDRRQLIHITSLGEARERSIGRRWGLAADAVDEFSYRSRSCFGLASSRVDESPLFLDMHFRSHPAIIGFSNERFYDGRMELCSESRPPQDLPAVQWVRVDGDSRKGPQGRSRENPVEAAAVANAVVSDAPMLAGLGLSLGVVTPYRAQADLIGGELVRRGIGDMAREVTVATAHRFQGDERDVIYFSPVVGPSMTERQAAWPADANLVNVALTRARRRLVIVGNMEACLSHRNLLADLARYVSRLEAGAFDSPLELALHEALLGRGVSAQTGVVVAGHRLDLAVQRDGHRLDIECDGAAFHTDSQADASRDRAIEAQGWAVLRFSGRRLSTDLSGCVDDVLAALEPCRDDPD